MSFRSDFRWHLRRREYRSPTRSCGLSQRKRSASTATLLSPIETWLMPLIWCRCAPEARWLLVMWTDRQHLYANSAKLCYRKCSNESLVSNKSRALNALWLHSTLVRAPDFRSTGRGFDSRTLRCRLRRRASRWSTCASVIKQTYQRKMRGKRTHHATQWPGVHGDLWLVPGWGQKNRRLATSYVRLWLEEDFTFFTYCYNSCRVFSFHTGTAFRRQHPPVGWVDNSLTAVVTRPHCDVILPR